MLPVRAVRLIAALGAGLLLSAGAAPAQDAQPVFTSKNSAYDGATQEAVFTGDARLVFGDTVLTADEIRYNAATRTASARGNLVINSGARRLVADEGSYDTATGRLTARNLRVGQFPVYVSGESVAGTFDELVFTNATVFFRENAAYTPSITATRLTYAKDRIVSAEGLGLGLLGGHFLRLPRFEHSLDADFISYISAHGGYRGRLGVFAELGFHLPVAEGVKLGADLGLYSSRGVMVGPSGSYHRAGADGRIDGSFRSGYIRDSGDRRLDILGAPVPHDRSLLTWEHRQAIGEHLTLDGTFSYWSDSEVYRDFRNKEFNRVQQPDSFLEAAYTADNYALSAFTRVHPNRYHRVQERLPEIRFDVMPLALPLGFYERFNASAAVIESDAFGADPAYWRAVSPAATLRPGARPLLAVCSRTRRDDPCAQSHAYAARAGAAGARAEVLPQALTHAEINHELGKPLAYTIAVERFLASLDPEIARRLASGRR